MSSIPVYYCQIQTDDVNLIGNLLEKENFLRQNSSSTFIKSNVEFSIQIDLSQSFESPSIICCCSTVINSLLQLLSFHNPKSDSIINLIISVQSTDTIDWNSLINLITTYNLSLNIAKNENDLRKKLDDIIHNLAKQNLSKKLIPNISNQHSPTNETQVIY
jgi:hypothetical protein